MTSCGDNGNRVSGYAETSWPTGTHVVETYPRATQMIVRISCAYHHAPLPAGALEQVGIANTAPLSAW